MSLKCFPVREGESWRGLEAQEALGFPQESLLQCKSKLRPPLGPMQSPGFGASGVLKTPTPHSAPSGGTTEVLGGALSSQLQVPAGPAAKVPCLSRTPRAEPLGKCSPGRSICAVSLVGVILTPTRKWLRPKGGESGVSQVMDGDRGLLGLGEGVPRQRHPSHSALALDPEAAAAAEARAPVPGILARILGRTAWGHQVWSDMPQATETGKTEPGN